MRVVVHNRFANENLKVNNRANKSFTFVTYKFIWAWKAIVLDIPENNPFY